MKSSKETPTLVYNRIMDEKVVPIHLDLDALQEGLSVPLWDKAKAYFEDGKVGVVNQPRPGYFTGEVSGGGTEPYAVSLQIENGRLASHSCTCEAHHRFPGPCKHVIALLLKVQALYGGDNPFDEGF